MDLGFKTKRIWLKKDSQSWSGNDKIIVHENGSGEEPSGAGKQGRGVPKQAAQANDHFPRENASLSGHWAWSGCRSENALLARLLP